jgi:hypothetical protein
MKRKLDAARLAGRPSPVRSQECRGPGGPQGREVVADDVSYLVGFNRIVGVPQMIADAANVSPWDGRAEE